MLWGKKKERRKNHKLRKEIDENQKMAEDVRELAKKLTATLNGEDRWFREVGAEEKLNGNSKDCVLDSVD